MSDLVKRLKTIAKTKRDWHRNLGLRGPDYALSAEIEHQAAAEIERLTAERDAALAKVAQYEQAPVVGWVCDDFIQDPCGSASCHNCGKRRSAHITTRPEVTK
jgi:hypothetical protein